MESSEIYKKYVCNRHFSTDFNVPGTRRGLRRDAFPNICLSAVVLQGKEKDDVHLTSMVEEAASVTSDFIQSPVIPNVEDETCFIQQQLRNQKLKPKSRRFTLKEKLLSLTLFKASAKAYRLLSKIFCLPSPGTLINLLNKIPLRPGLNKRLMDSFKQSVAKLKENDEQDEGVIDGASV
ncbi:uncharacterized protein LOC135130948 isoform X1 [Zophobas morio]|uniref:uncharacterized protein LOC135130948 isoform X1 n=1 Tax=Zophobas morio TaxID=2755281 RepID=UPI0030828141